MRERSSLRAPPGRRVARGAATSREACRRASRCTPSRCAPPCARSACRICLGLTLSVLDRVVQQRLRSLPTRCRRRASDDRRDLEQVGDVGDVAALAGLRAVQLGGPLDGAREARAEPARGRQPLARLGARSSRAPAASPRSRSCPWRRTRSTCTHRRGRQRGPQRDRAHRLDRCRGEAARSCRCCRASRSCGRRRWAPAGIRPSRSRGWRRSAAACPP